MNPGLKASASGMRAQQLRIDAIANNLANVNTTGFKRSRVSFQDLLYETLQGTRLVNYQNAESVGPVQIGRGVRLAAIERVHTQGSLEPTSRPTDIAVEGEGFFMVQMPSGDVAYTRSGNFTISDTGALVTHEGFAVLGVNEAPILVPTNEAGQIAIGPSGQVSLSVNSDSVVVGELALARFVNPSGLEALGGNLYGRTEASGEPQIGLPLDTGYGRVLQGMLETSNVEIVQEMVDMITAQRAYEVNSKAIQTAEEMIQNAINSLNR